MRLPFSALLQALSSSFDSSAPFLADVMPLNEQSAIEYAALAAHEGDSNHAELYRVTAGYGGLDGD